MLIKVYHFIFDIANLRQVSEFKQWIRKSSV